MISKNVIYPKHGGGHWYEFFGLSQEEKPLDKVTNRSEFYEMDTSTLYMFDGENKEWIKQSPGGGGSSEELEEIKSQGGVGWEEHVPGMTIDVDMEAEPEEFLAMYDDPQLTIGFGLVSHDVISLNGVNNDESKVLYYENEFTFQEYTSADRYEIKDIGGGAKLYIAYYGNNGSAYPLIITNAVPDHDIYFSGYSAHINNIGTFAYQQLADASNDFYVSKIVSDDHTIVHKIDDKFVHDMSDEQDGTALVSIDGKMEFNSGYAYVKKHDLVWDLQPVDDEIIEIDNLHYIKAFSGISANPHKLTVSGSGVVRDIPLIGSLQISFSDINFEAGYSEGEFLCALQVVMPFPDALPVAIYNEQNIYILDSFIFSSDSGYIPVEDSSLTLTINETHPMHSDLTGLLIKSEFHYEDGSFINDSISINSANEIESALAEGCDVKMIADVTVEYAMTQFYIPLVGANSTGYKFINSAANVNITTVSGELSVTGNFNTDFDWAQQILSDASDALADLRGGNA